MPQWSSGFPAIVVNRACFRRCAIAFLAALWSVPVPGIAAVSDEFQAKRQTVYEFVRGPTLERDGDTFRIGFTTKAYCDVTVAIENKAGRIVRHLASGVLGANAPFPLKKDSLAQSIVWDGKDDSGDVVDVRSGCVARVSLGLKPRFERALYWSPYRRYAQMAPLIHATDEGVLVYEAQGIDSLRMYRHDGTYLRTVYPFPADKYAQVKGLQWKDFPQGVRRPLKQGMYRQTLLTSGGNIGTDNRRGRNGHAAKGMGLRGKHVFLVDRRLNRLLTDGTTGGKALQGGRACVKLDRFRIGWNHNNTVLAGATSVAISPDMKIAYLAGFSYRYPYHYDTQHGVMKMGLEGEGEASVFTGAFGARDVSATRFGSGPGQFKNAASVDVDASGRVYVADYMNDRIQVLSPEGNHLKDIKTNKPAVVRVHRRTQEIWVFSWLIPSSLLRNHKPPLKFESSLVHLGAFENPVLKAKWKLPIEGFKGHVSFFSGLPYPLWYTGEIDSWTDPPTIWLGRQCRYDMETGVHPGDGGRMNPWEKSGILLLRPDGAELKVIKDFGKETQKAVARAKPPTHAIQRLYVNPVTGMLYVAEADSGPTIKASKGWIEIDPASGKSRIIKLPFNALEGAFDLTGLVYLRTADMIARYTFPDFREVPFDYGEERPDQGNDGRIFGKAVPVVGGLRMPSVSPVCYHQGGFHVSPRGHIVASCACRYVGFSRKHFQTRDEKIEKRTAYRTRPYPGRIANNTSPCIHVWDKRGRMIHEDAVPGVAQIDGVAMDRDDNIYLMHTPTRVLRGKPYFDGMSETLLKVKPGKARFLSARDAPVPLQPADRPRRPMDLADMWAEGVEWFYGGVGFAGFNAPGGKGCACWFSRFCLDLFARSIAPEPSMFSVAVLDANGNLILRIGRPGNADSAGPGSAVALDGDQVALFHACYVGTHTDRRIFIADHGNNRIVSVKLDYHVSRKVSLRGTMP